MYLIYMRATGGTDERVARRKTLVRRASGKGATGLGVDDSSGGTGTAGSGGAVRRAQPEEAPRVSGSAATSDASARPWECAADLGVGGGGRQQRSRGGGVKELDVGCLAPPASFEKESRRRPANRA
ncbi:hypothetical protein EVAR_81219_1 [Eumeta japonica]|uniref:Uncharacterized protein n=1 Tax=Eumeta variegata TaxID=151549 RepID=A0A4C1V294_EUMVA|nr:hypothetical protein EVAR_81219_1 [Eumeta japonica]